eukprot:6480147-Amphidinium_carterae.1
MQRSSRNFRKSLRCEPAGVGEGRSLYRDLVEDFYHHGDVLKRFKSARCCLLKPLAQMSGKRVLVGCLPLQQIG